MPQEAKERGNGGVKTLAIRLDEVTHTQLSIIAQLRSSTITEEIRQAIEHHIEQTRSNPELTAQAETALEDIEREVSTRRAAIAALLGEAPAKEAPTGRSKAARQTPQAAPGGQYL